MKITLDDNKKLCEIQKEFNKHFPFLKLEFFESKSAMKGIFSKKNLIQDTDKTLKEIAWKNKSGDMNISSSQKVHDVEKQFVEKFGIYIQVFRKSHNCWLLTNATDNWTLFEQNKRGEEMDIPVNKEIVEDFDQYHEQT